MKEKVLLEWKASTPNMGMAMAGQMWGDPFVVLFFIIAALVFFGATVPSFFGKGLVIFILVFYSLVFVMGLLLKKFTPKVISEYTFKITNTGVFRIPGKETRAFKPFLTYHRYNQRLMGAFSPNTMFYKPFTGIKYYQIRNQKIEFVSKLTPLHWYLPYFTIVPNNNLKSILPVLKKQGILSREQYLSRSH